IANAGTSVANKLVATLFPMSIVVINSLGLETKFNSLSDFLSPLRAFVCNFILFVAVKAVSLPEKKNETNNKNMIAMITLFSPSYENKIVRFIIPLALNYLKLKYVN